jgi:hypothetical protein
MCVLEHRVEAAQEMGGKWSSGTPHGQLSGCGAFGQAEPHEAGDCPSQRRVLALCGAQSQLEATKSELAG